MCTSAPTLVPPCCFPPATTCPSIGVSDFGSVLRSSIQLHELSLRWQCEVLSAAASLLHPKVYFGVDLQAETRSRDGQKWQTQRQVTIWVLAVPAGVEMLLPLPGSRCQTLGRSKRGTSAPTHLPRSPCICPSEEASSWFWLGTAMEAGLLLHRAQGRAVGVQQRPTGNLWVKTLVLAPDRLSGDAHRGGRPQAGARLRWALPPHRALASPASFWAASASPQDYNSQPAPRAAASNAPRHWLLRRQPPMRRGLVGRGGGSWRCLS